MKQVIIVVCTLLLTQFIIAQYEPYLYIERGEVVETSISYPPNTEFYLFNDQGDLVLSEGDLNEPFEITTVHTLLLSPSYKEGTDRLVLTSGRISMKTPYQNHTGNTSNIKEKDLYGRYTGPITATKEYFPSKNKGEKNVLVIFSNDLVFRYFDGKARAWYEGEEVKIKGKFIIELPDSTAKLSYNPKNGETWWVFEKMH